MARNEDPRFAAVGGEPDYDAPALEEDTVAVAPKATAPAPTPATPAKKPTLYERRLNEYRERVYNPERVKFISDRIKGFYPAIPRDADPNEVITRYKKAFAADMSDEEFQTKLDETHGLGWEPSVEEPKPNLIEMGQMVATPQVAAELGKGIVHFGGAQAISKLTEKAIERQGPLPKALTAGPGKAPATRSLGRIGGQIAAMVPTGIKLAAAQIGGTEMERLAQEMPAPNVELLRQKGYSEAQIANVLRGYADVQRELYGEMEKFGQEGVSASAEGIANAALLGFGGERIERAVTRLMDQKALTGGARAVAAATARGAVAHGATGAVLGGSFGAIHGATERAAKAKAAGLGANDIFTAAVEGGWEEGKAGAVIGGILGGAIGAPLTGVSTKLAANANASVMRKAISEAQAEDALRINLQKFADDFRPNELPERFPEDLAASAGNDVALAQNLISSVWGPEVAATEHGMQAASRLYEKIISWRGTRDRLSGNMVDLPPAPVPPPPVVPGAAPAVPFEGFQPTAAPPAQVGAVPPVPGMVQMAGEVPGQVLEPTGMAPAFRPTPEQPGRVPLQQALSEAFVPPAEGIQPVGAAVPEPPAQPLVLEGVQPREGTSAPRLGPPLGPIERVGQPAPTAPEIAPRLEAPEAAAVTAAAEGPKGSARAPAEGLAGVSAIEPRPARLPSVADDAAKLTKNVENAEVEVSPNGQYLVINKLGVNPAEVGQRMAQVAGVKEQGASSKALSHINAIADEHGLAVETIIQPTAGPRGGKIPLDKLIPWYEQHGYRVFHQGKDFALVRRTPEMAELARRARGLSPETARVATGNVELGKQMAHAGFGERLGKFLNTQAEAAQARIKARGTRLYSMGLDPAAITDHAIIAAAQMFSKGLRTKSAVSNWLIDTYGDVIRPHIDTIYEKARTRLGRMFKTQGLADKRLRELVELRDSGRHGMDWYENTADWVRKTFGPEDQDMFLRFLALTSADSSTEGGAALAMKAFAQWKQGLPFDGMRGPHMVKMLEDAVRGGDFGGDKIQSFYRALRGDKDAVVLDRWMIRALGLPSSKSSLAENDYRLYAQIVRNLASDADMSPRQFQAAVWEGARVGEAHKRWKKGGAQSVAKIGSARPLEDLLQDTFGGLTPYQWVQRNRIKHETLANMSAGMKAAREQGGYTFNPRTWETDPTPGYVVTLASDVVPRQEFYPAALTKFKNQFEKLLSREDGPHLNIGVFNMGEYKPGHFSMDLNVLLPNTGPEALAMAKKIGKLNRQLEIGEIGPDGNYVQGHKTGYNPKKHGPQFVPPAKGPARTAWFRSAAARARTLLDSISFKLE